MISLLLTALALAGPPLTKPSKLHATAPDRFKVVIHTTKGPFTLQIERALAPRGADRFYNLVRGGFFQNMAFFRAIDGFMVQFGVHGDPAISSAWIDQRMPDDPVKGTNTRGTISFAMAGPNTRTTQLFINLADNQRLDGMGFAPIGQVVAGLEVIDQLYTGYGEGAPGGHGPDQNKLQRRGNGWLRKRYAKLDYIVSSEIRR